MKLDAQSPFGAPTDTTRLLSAVFELVSDVLCELPPAEPKELPRMADHALLFAAMTRLVAHQHSIDLRNCGDARQGESIEADHVAVAVEGSMSSRDNWKGAAADLFRHLPVESAPESWPKTAAALSGRLRTASPALLQVGLQVNIGRDGHGRWIRIKHRKVPD